MKHESSFATWRWLLATALCIFGLSIFLVATQTARAEQPVRVAVAGPMVGTSYAVGVQYKVGVNAALKALPDGKLLGRPVVISLHDDNCKAPIAESVALEIVKHPPDVVIGHSCSGATITAAPIYAEHQVLQITPASTNPRVTEMGVPTIFRMIGRDDIQGELAARRIAERHRGKRIGMHSFHGEYSVGLASVALETLRSHGIAPVVHIEMTKGSQASYAEQIEALMAHHVEVLYQVGGALDCGVFLRQARRMGAQFDVIGSDTLVSDVFVQTAGSAAENIPFTFPPDAVALPTAGRAVQAIEALNQEPAGYTLLAYAAVEVWIEGVRRAQSLDAAQVAEAIRRAPITTILGEVSFDHKGDIITQSPPFVWYVWKDGQRVAAD